MVAHEPDGSTTGAERENERANVRATLRAARRWPLLKAGCPQQTCPRGISTSYPACRSSTSASAAASGNTRSARQVAKSCTRCAPTTQAY